MLTSRFVAKAFCFALPLLVTNVAFAQEYPNRPIRIYTSAPGGAIDTITRIVAQGMTAPLGQPVVMDNRGGSGVIPGELTAKAAPDGYTLLAQTPTLWMSSLLEDNIPYDAFRDFSPITQLASAPSVVVSPASLPVKSIKELIALAKARPGELNYARISIGASNHLGAELFNAMAGVKIVPISYRGAALATADLISGEVQLLWATMSTAGPHIKSGRLKALAVTSAEPSALMPGLPTVASGGLPGYVISTSYGLFAPAKTPEAIIRRLNQEAVRVLRTAEAKERLFNVGAEPVGSTPEQLTAVMKAEVTTMGKVIKQAGIRAQ
jgi:tripartite-type tricarboxylate transporter receptor subunit TctC